MSVSQRSDFVLGLSLAEIILLLMFSFFLVVALENNPDGGREPLSVRLARALEDLNRVQHELEAVKAELKATKDVLRERDDLIEQLRQMSGAAGTSLADFRKVLKGPGYPPCTERQRNNVLEVSVVHGSISARVGALDTDLESALRGSGGSGVASASLLREKEELQPFLDAVIRFAQARECRYAYRLLHTETGDDYKTARQYFERYLYPGGGQ